MKMKDKLVKYNHKATYYRMKKFALSFAIFAGLAITASVPMTLKMMPKSVTAPHAEQPTEKAEEETEDNKTEDNSVTADLEYNVL